MPLVTPPTVTALPNAPDPNNRTTFNTLAYPWSNALNPFSVQLQALSSNVYANAVYAIDTTGSYLASTLTAKDLAETAAEAAAAAANFKGLWSAQTGQMLKPASVKHNGRFWLLLNNLANVALSEPGVSADWTSTTTGTEITQTITTTTTAVIGVTYIVDGSGIELDFPTTSLQKGDFVGYVPLGEPTTNTIDLGSERFMKEILPDGKLSLDTREKGLKFIYEDTTYGWWAK